MYLWKSFTGSTLLPDTPPQSSNSLDNESKTPFSNDGTGGSGGGGCDGNGGDGLTTPSRMSPNIFLNLNIDHMGLERGGSLSMEWSTYPPSAMTSNSLNDLPSTSSKSPPSQLTYETTLPTSVSSSSSSSTLIKASSSSLELPDHSQHHIDHLHHQDHQQHSQHQHHLSHSSSHHHQHHHQQQQQHQHQQHHHHPHTDVNHNDEHSLISVNCFNTSLDLVDNTTSTSTYDEMKFLNVDQYTIEQLKAECILNMDQTLSLGDEDADIGGDGGDGVADGDRTPPTIHHLNMPHTSSNHFEHHLHQHSLCQALQQQHSSTSSLFNMETSSPDQDPYILSHHPTHHHMQLQTNSHLTSAGDSLHQHLHTLNLDLPGVFGLTTMVDSKSPPLLVLDKPLSLNISVDGINDLVDDKF